MPLFRRVFVAVAFLWWSLGPLGPSGVGAVAYSVSLSATPTTLESGETTVLTVTASYELATTRYAVYIYDDADPMWYRTCKAQSCSFEVTQQTAGSHTYTAYLARERSNPRYPPVQVQAASNPVSVTWSNVTFTVSLTGDPTWVPPGSTSVLTAETNKDMSGRPYALQIFDLTTRQRIAICSTGTTCTAFVTEVSQTTKTYQAFVATPGESSPPPNAQAGSNIVSVTWSVLPDSSRPPNIGGGPVTGAVEFTGPGVPPVGAPCATTNFDFTGTSDSAWVNGSGTAYVGPLTITAHGGAGCETASTGGGPLTVSASGSNGVGHLVCGPLEGTFTRAATDVTIVVNGDCVINDFPAIRISFVAKGEFVPTNDGGGTTVAVTHASFAGSFTVLPT